MRPRTNIDWKRVSNLPTKMLQPQVVATKDKVYAGGGLAKESMQKIFTYNIDSDNWTTLPETQAILFGLCIFKDELLTVGGGECEAGITGKVYKLNKGGVWTESLPAMSISRFSHSVFTTDLAIVACGGAVWKIGRSNPEPCTTVEVYQSETDNWFCARNLPRPCAAMSSTAIGNTCYLIGNLYPQDRSGPIYTDITNITIPQPSDDSLTAPKPHWHHLSPPPLLNTSIVATSSYLLAVGGCNKHGHSQRAVHIYTKKSKCWWRLAGGDLPVQLESPGIAMLESGKLMVVGGEDVEGEFTDGVFIGNSL